MSRIKNIIAFVVALSLISIGIKFALGDKPATAPALSATTPADSDTQVKAIPSTADVDAAIAHAQSLHLATTMPTIGPATNPAAIVNKTCPIDVGNPIDPNVTIQYQGMTIGFCCPDCVPAFMKDPEKYIAKMH